MCMHGGAKCETLNLVITYIIDLYHSKTGDVTSPKIVVMAINNSVSYLYETRLFLTCLTLDHGHSL